MRVTIAAVALLLIGATATASAASQSLRGQDQPQQQLQQQQQLDDMEVDASVLIERTRSEFDSQRRRLQDVGAVDAASTTDTLLYRESFSTPIDSHSTLVVRGQCIQWFQKPDQFRALLPPGYDDQRAKQPKMFESSKQDKFKDFDFKKLCSRGNRKNGNAADGDCSDMFNAIRGLGTAALDKARFCELTKSLPCSMPDMDDVAIRIINPTQPFGDPDADFKVKSVNFDDCSIKIDFESPGNRPSVWSTIEITALFPPPPANGASASSAGAGTGGRNGAGGNGRASPGRGVKN